LKNNNQSEHISSVNNVPRWLLGFVKERKFISIDDVISEHSTISRKTAIEYLYQLSQKKIIYNAGHGLYRTFEKREFKPIISTRMSKIAEVVHKELPFTDFTIWSTEQISPLSHLMIGRHVVFVESEAESAIAIHEVLMDNEIMNFYKPKKEELGKFLELTEFPVIVRSRSKQSATISVDGFRTSSLEKLLFDLYFNISRGYLNLSLTEYGKILRNSLEGYNIYFKRLLSYSDRSDMKSEFNYLLSQIQKHTNLPIWIDQDRDRQDENKIIASIMEGICGGDER